MRRVLAAVAWSVVVSSSGAALAQEMTVWEPDFDFEQFTASPDPQAVAVIDGARTLEKWSYGTGLVLSYSDTPLEVCMEPPDGGACEGAGAAISSRVRADVVAALGLGRVELRLVIPAVLDQGTPLEPPMGEEGLASMGIADLRPGVKVRLYQRGALGVAAAADLTLPMGGGGANFIGDAGVSITPRALIDFRRGRFAVAGGLGYRWRSESAELANVVVDDQVVWSIGGEVAVVPKITVGMSAYGALGVAGDDLGSEERPVEAVLNGRWWVTDHIAVEAGGGPGLAPGIGSPEVRLFAGVRFANIVYDEDHDGIADARDRCPTVAEDVDGFEDVDGCPDVDNDRDEVADVADKCPNEAEDRDSFQDEDGCPDDDDDQDGIADKVDKCRLEREDIDSFQDEDGCPDEDNDGDKIVDVSDKCPNEPETVNEHEDTDGCPDEKPQQLVTVTATQIQITDKIFFDLNRARIRRRSYPILDAVADVMNDNPQMRVRIEGHTDDRGSEEFNLKLSQRRAEAVMKYLVKKGIRAERLEAIGYGKTRPVVQAVDEEARSANRRVEFFILSGAGGAAGAGDNQDGQ